MEEIELAKEFGFSLHEIIQSKLEYAKSMCRIDTPYLSPTEKRLRDKKYYEERETNYLSSRVYWTDRLRRSEGWQREYCAHYLRENEQELETIRRRLRFVSSPRKDLVKIDFQEIKQIPIGNLFEVNNAGFFINNPLRNERSPSNSLHWNKATNKWKDFGSGEGGDIIDIVQKINKCSLIEACKIIMAC